MERHRMGIDYVRSVTDMKKVLILWLLAGSVMAQDTATPTPTLTNTTTKTPTITNTESYNWMYVPDPKLGKYKTSNLIPVSCVAPADTHTPVPTHTLVPTATPYGDIGGNTISLTIAPTPAAWTLAQIQAAASGTPSLMLVADDINITSGNPVTNWVDRVQAVTFTQATAGNRPLYYTNVMNGKAAIRNGAGVTQTLATGSVTLSSIFGSTQSNIYIVYKQNANSGVFEVYNPYSTNGVWYRSIANLQYSYGSSSTGIITVAKPAGYDGVFNIVSLSRSVGNVMSIYNNGVSILSGTVGDTDGFNIGVGETASVTIMRQVGGGYLNGDISCLIIFPRYIAPGSDEDKSIYNGLASYYGLPLYPSTASKPLNIYDALGNLAGWINENIIANVRGLISGPVSITAINDADVPARIYAKTTTGSGNLTEWYGPSSQTTPVARMSASEFNTNQYVYSGDVGMFYLGSGEFSAVRTSSITLSTANTGYNILNTGSNSITVTLPSLFSSTKYLRKYTFYKSSASNVAILNTSAGNIFQDGSGSVTLGGLYEYIILSGETQSATPTWRVVSRGVGMESFNSFSVPVTVSDGVTGTTAGFSGALNSASVSTGPATVTSIYIDATPTPVVPMAGVTLIFKGGVCVGVNP